MYIQFELKSQEFFMYWINILLSNFNIQCNTLWLQQKIEINAVSLSIIYFKY